jgi:hypothetical protein
MLFVVLNMVKIIKIIWQLNVRLVFGVQQNCLPRPCLSVLQIECCLYKKYPR